MEEFIALVVGLVGLGLLIMPIVSLVFASRARGRLRELTAEHEAQDRKLTYLYEQVRGLQKTVAALQAAPPTPRAAELEDTLIPAGPRTTPEAVAAPPDLDDTAPQPAADPTPSPAGPVTEGGATPEATPGPAPQPEPERAPAPPPPPKVPLEERMATLFTRVGAGALVLGVLYFFKYAVDNEWIGPSGRVLAGVVTGLAVLVGAEVIRARTSPGYVHALSGVGLAFLYISAYASSAWYHLVGLEVAFGATAVILALGAALAWRYHAEAVLVLVLVAGLLTPKLLSTGQDRPLALFAYLLLLTSAVLFVSAQRSFRIAIGLAIVGVHIMAVGWYTTFFDVHDFRGQGWGGDRDPSELVGAYLEFSPRIVPLVFSALFAAQWIFGALHLHRRNQGAARAPLAMWVVPLATIATVFLHGAVCALLYDRPVDLGAGIIVVGAASVLVMRYLSATRWLMVPMGVAFMVLIGLSQDVRGTDQTILLVMIGVWTAVYVVAFLRDALGEGKTISAADAVRTQLALHAFAALACLMLLPEERAVAAAAAVTLTALPAAFVASRAVQPGLLIFGQAFSLGGLLLGAAVAREDDLVAWHPAIVGLALVWATIHAFAALRLPEEKRSATAGLISLCGALLGALAVAMLTTHDSAPTLRALFTAGAGIASLGGATYLTRRGEDYAAWTSTLAAMSLGLFAAAMAFGLSGAPVTVLWAALTAIAGTVVARARTPVWMLTFQLLAVATLWRLAAVDVAEAARITRVFFYSNGAEGVLSLPVLFNPRAYALAGTGVAFLIGAGLLGRSLRLDPRSSQLPLGLLQGSAGVIAILGYALLTAVLIIETRAALTELPVAPPMALDAAEFDAFWQTVQSARQAHTATLDVATTVVLGVVGVCLVAAGFAFKDPFHRYLGLLVLLITIGKLITWDVWKVSRIYRVVVLTAIGGLLLVSGFLYARLKVLFTKGSVSTGAGLLIMTLGLGLARAEPEAKRIEAHMFRRVAEVQGLGEPGDHRLVVPPELFDHSDSGEPFEDLRLTDAEGHLVPFIVQQVPPERPSHWVPGRMFDSGTLPGGGSRAVFEVPDGTEHCELTLDVKGQGPFLRRTQIETGVTQDDLQVVASGAIVYSIGVDGRRFERARLAYPQSIARYVRVTLEPDADAEPTEIKGARFGCLTPLARAPRDGQPLSIVSQAPDPESNSTFVVLDVGQAGLPIERLDLTVKSPAELVRRVQIQSSSFEQVWPAVGSGVLYRVAGSSPTEDLTLSVRPAKKRWFRLKIENGDNPPLDVSAVQGSWPRHEVLFRTSSPGPVRLYIGSKDAYAPKFDLQDIMRRRTTRPDYRETTLSALADNPVFGRPDAARAVPITERYRGPIGVALAVILLLLGMWAIRLVRSAPPTESGP